MTFSALLHSLPQRKTYPNGRLRPITKAQDAAFVAAVLIYMQGYPTTPAPCDHWHAWTIDSDFGPFQVTLCPGHSTR